MLMEISLQILPLSVVKIDLYREIEHKADLAYEIFVSDIDELLRDLIEIFKENAETESSKNFEILNDNLQNIVKKCYNIKMIKDKDESDEFIDSVFDAVNDIISLIDRGYFPVKAENSCVYLIPLRVIFRIKALTYHSLRVKVLGSRIHFWMVFDV